MKNRIIIFSVLLLQIAFLGSANAQWLLNGNNGIGPANFLGTRNNADLILKTNNIEVGRFTPALSGSIGKANTVAANCTGSFAAGQSNFVDVGSNHSIALGYSNEVTAQDGIALGANNVVAAPHSFCIGSDMQVTADHAFAVGTYITNNIPNSIILGIGQPGVYIQEAVGGSLVGINTTTPSVWSVLDVNGDIYSYGNWIGSDKRFKKEIKTLDNALDKVLALRGTEYFFTNDQFKDKNFPTEKQIGFIAQEMEQVVPNLVRSNGGTGYTVNYTGLIPVIVEAMKEQQMQIQEKDVAITCLQNQVENLEARLAKLEAKLLSLPSDDRTIEQVKTEKAFGIAPNPTSGHFILTLPEVIQTGAATVLVFDGMGREVARRAIEVGSNVAEFNLDLPNGLYNVSLLSQGKLSATQSIVVGK